MSTLSALLGLAYPVFPAILAGFALYKWQVN